MKIEESEDVSEMVLASFTDNVMKEAAQWDFPGRLPGLF